MKKFLIRPLSAACLMTLLAGAQAATLTVTSRDPAGVGFNDSTAVAPVGGNPGTTLGEQRFNVYKKVADIWGAALDSNVEIRVSAAWEALSCTATQAVLGSASAWNFSRDFANAPKAFTWYPLALANKLAGVNLLAGVPDDGTGFGNFDIKTQFNVNLGKSNCLAGTPFYLGLDGNAPSGQVNFMTTLLHEMGHGLGFSLGMTSTSTGRHANEDGTVFVTNGGVPMVWESFMVDGTSGKLWVNMTDAERKASAINTNKLAWAGSMAVAGAAQTLLFPTVATVTSGPQTTKFGAIGTALFGPAVAAPTNFGQLKDMASQGCETFTPGEAAAVAGKVAVIDRGTCAFLVKTQNAQAAGASAVIIVNNTTGVINMSGDDSTITIPSIMVSNTDGAALRSAIVSATKYGSRGTPGLATAKLIIDTSGNRAGADANGRPLLFAPNPLVSGSSVSHYDVSAFPNQLMEPNINADLTTSLVPPLDLTLPLLKDIGW